MTSNPRIRNSFRMQSLYPKTSYRQQDSRLTGIKWHNALFLGGLVRLLVLSDIHANLDALEACLAAAPPYDGVANLGDVVGYGACPNEVVDKARAMGEIFVRGNHDRACSGLSDASDFNSVAFAAATWTKNTLTDDNRVWVRDLPRGPITDANWPDFQFVHGSPLDEDEYILSAPMAEIALDSSPFALTFFGHTHVQGIIGLKDRQLYAINLPRGLKDRLDHHSVAIEPGTRYLVNPGSVGQPRDGDPRAAFAVYDTADKSVTFFRVPYDIAKAQHRIIAAGLPERLASRLADGR
jgi:diadenosine tetraphosphatase ApaH/serine/threonine PP2A family protein phosphatase